MLFSKITPVDIWFLLPAWYMLSIKAYSGLDWHQFTTALRLDDLWKEGKLRETSTIWGVVLLWEVGGSRLLLAIWTTASSLYSRHQYILMQVLEIFSWNICVVPGGDSVAPLLARWTSGLAGLAQCGFTFRLLIPTPLLLCHNCPLILYLSSHPKWLLCGYFECVI